MNHGLPGWLTAILARVVVVLERARALLGRGATGLSGRWRSVGEGSGVDAARALRGVRRGLAAPVFYLRAHPGALRRAVIVALVPFLLGGVTALELGTSEVQSRLLTMIASRLDWRLEPGPSPSIVLPRHGPSDIVRGYAGIPAFSARLEERGFRVVEQARFSPALRTAARLGITPPYREPVPAGLVIYDRAGNVLYDARKPRARFERYEDVPGILVNALLLMENRRLAAPLPPHANPAVDWARLSRAIVFSAASRVGLPTSFQGGSTLAVQLEKVRHSEGGRTGSIADKLRQMASASLRAYRDGRDTRPGLREIVLDYLNTVPLGAAPGHGEVFGIPEGLGVWFGVGPDEVRATLAPAGPPGSPGTSIAAQARALKPVLALLCAVRAPTRLLAEDRAQLERRVSYYEDRLLEAGLIGRDLRARLAATPIRFAPPRRPPAPPFDERKAADRVRRDLVRLLGVRDLYELDRLDLAVETSLDAALLDTTTRLFDALADTHYVAAEGLVGPRLLDRSGPGGVVYSVLLCEAGPEGNVEVLRADNLDSPFDFNQGARIELGSTAKLRTLAHYLEIVEQEHRALAASDAAPVEARLAAAHDPITAWVAAELASEPGLSLDSLLARALERRYSASPHEAFYTGGGLHTFGNFDPDDDARTPSVREALVRSINLSFIRLMRDLVRWHQARLPYDTEAVLEQVDHPERRRLLREAADDEARALLARAWRRLRDLPVDGLPGRFLDEVSDADGLAVLGAAWNAGASPESLAAWLAARDPSLDSVRTRRLAESHAGLTLLDCAYLLRRHPLELWLAGQRFHDPAATFDEMLARSESARTEAQSWLFQPRHRRAQDMRLRARIERDAFDRMTVAWKRLEFPFERLVPSLATAIGSSADRPEALAALMGVIVNDGVRRSQLSIRRVRFGPGTPYETSLEAGPPREERVLSPQVARTIRGALGDVVEHGTARRVRSAFRDGLGTPIEIGGKTGSGDNRVGIFARGGKLVTSHPTSRTAAFAFYLSDRYYGVVTVAVVGPESGRYHFTSALALEVLKRLAPALRERLG